MSVINIEEDVLQTKTPRDFYSSTPQPKLNSATNLQDGESIRTRRPSLNNVKENTDNGANAPQERRVNRHISAQGHTNNFGHRDISLPLIDSKVTKQEVSKKKKSLERPITNIKQRYNQIMNVYRTSFPEENPYSTNSINSQNQILLRGPRNINQELLQKKIQRPKRTPHLTELTKTTIEQNTKLMLFSPYSNFTKDPVHSQVAWSKTSVQQYSSARINGNNEKELKESSMMAATNYFSCQPGENIYFTSDKSSVQFLNAPKIELFSSEMMEREPALIKEFPPASPNKTPKNNKAPSGKMQKSPRANPMNNSALALEAYNPSRDPEPPKMTQAKYLTERRHKKKLKNLERSTSMGVSQTPEVNSQNVPNPSGRAGKKISNLKISELENSPDIVSLGNKVTSPVPRIMIAPNITHRNGSLPIVLPNKEPSKSYKANNILHSTPRNHILGEVLTDQSITIAPKSLKKAKRKVSQEKKDQEDSSYRIVINPQVTANDFIEQKRRPSKPQIGQILKLESFGQSSARESPRVQVSPLIKQNEYKQVRSNSQSSPKEEKKVVDRQTKKKDMSPDQRYDRLMNIRIEDKFSTLFRMMRTKNKDKARKVQFSAKND